MTTNVLAKQSWPHMEIALDKYPKLWACGRGFDHKSACLSLLPSKF